MTPAPKAQGNAARRRRSTLSRRPSREALTLTVKYRGGAECWWEIKARGAVWRFPGVMALHDVMREINVDESPR